MNQFNWSLYKGNLEWLPDSTIILTQHGSRCFGLNTPESDLDVKGITVPPKEYFHGFLKRFEQAEGKDPDLVIYDIRKFISLAADGNPSIIEVLFTDEEFWYIIPNPRNRYAGDKLRNHRELFLSRKMKHTFGGYSHAQLKRVKTHRQWLLNPREEKPTRDQYGLPGTTLLSADILGAIDAVNEKRTDDVKIEFPAHLMALYHKERAYQNALREYQQYQNWKAMRNPKRAKLEAEMGFDGKHAMHLVRLLKMCREILTTGKVIVKRPDREELLAIRRGEWKYDELIEWAEGQDAELTELEKTSPLPHGPDRNKLDQLCQEIVEMFL